MVAGLIDKTAGQVDERGRFGGRTRGVSSPPASCSTSKLRGPCPRPLCRGGGGGGGRGRSATDRPSWRAPICSRSVRDEERLRRRDSQDPPLPNPASSGCHTTMHSTGHGGESTNSRVPVAHPSATHPGAWRCWLAMRSASTRPTARRFSTPASAPVALRLLAATPPVIAAGSCSTIPAVGERQRLSTEPPVAHAAKTHKPSAARARSTP